MSSFNTKKLIKGYRRSENTHLNTGKRGPQILKSLKKLKNLEEATEECNKEKACKGITLDEKKKKLIYDYLMMKEQNQNKKLG